MANLTGLVSQHDTTEYLTKLLPYRQMFLNYGISVSSQVQIFCCADLIYTYVCCLWFLQIPSSLHASHLESITQSV